MEPTEPIKHVHVFIAVATVDWLGRPIIRSRCSCGASYIPDELGVMRIVEPTKETL